jgi:electron transfer flavoprotein alpha subunit
VVVDRLKIERKNIQCMSESKSVWVLIERKEGRIEAASLETLSCGRRLTDDLGGRLVAVLVGSGGREQVGELASYGADEELLIDNPRLVEYSAELYVEALYKLIRDETPDIFLCGATLISRDLAPRLAARLGTGLVSECIGLAIEQDGRLSATRLTYGGMISSTILYAASGTRMATVRPGIMTIARKNSARKAEIRTVVPGLEVGESRVHLKGVVKADPDKISLDEADVILAGGKGMAGRENFQLLEELAGKLGGIVAASLGAIDEGWLPRKKLVGQTGVTIAPKLYVACGISGSVYHVLGMRDSRFVIAINKDRNAPIFKVADMSIIGDAADTIIAILEKLRGLSETTGKNNGEAGNAGKV